VTDKTSSAQSADTRSACISMAVVASAMLMVRPFADIGYADDFAYADVALKLVRSGHLVYNGWESAMLVSHAYWGALFTRLFGFSFLCLRFSTMPFAIGTVGLCYLLVRQAGLRSPHATLVALLFGLSPILLPVSVSYMTDVPCLFFMFASLYSLSRSATSSKLGSYIWLGLGAVSGFWGGTGRQAAWLVPLIVLPYLAWVKRRRISLFVPCLTSWILILGGVVGVTAWFNHQLYTILQPSILSELKLVVKRPLPEINMTARLALMLLLLCLPAALPLVLRSWFDTWHGTRLRQITVALLFLGLISAILIHPSLASIPWIYNTLDWQGINGTSPLPGRPVVLTAPIRALVAIPVYAAVCVLAGELLSIRDWARRALRLLLNPSDSEFPLAALSLFTVSYFVLVVVRAVDFDIFDRYLLPILPGVATILLLWLQADSRGERMLKRAIPFSWALLAIFAMYAIASTQDLWALAQARVTAAKTLEAAGVPRTEIDGGFEFNGWTQLMVNGRINSRWVANPPGAYDPRFGQTPSVVPLYRLEYQPTPETPASQFGSVPYFSFLPPFHKQVSIDRVLLP
jgi:hypothetical protein